jgi:hypothetical protein
MYSPPLPTLAEAQDAFMNADQLLYEYAQKTHYERPSGPLVDQLVFDWSEARAMVLHLVAEELKEQDVDPAEALASIEQNKVN